MVESAQLVSIEDFFLLPNLDAGKREFIEGEVIELPPARAFHYSIANRIGDALKDYLKELGQRRDRVCVESGFEIPAAKRSWLQPDVSILHPGQPVNKNGYFEGSPWIAIEVISPSNRARDIDRKRAIYLANGSEEVWVVYPDTLTVTIERANQAGIVRHQESISSAALPGFRMDFGDLFGAL